MRLPEPGNGLGRAAVARRASVAGPATPFRSKPSHPWKATIAWRVRPFSEPFRLGDSQARRGGSGSPPLWRRTSAPQVRARRHGAPPLRSEQPLRPQDQAESRGVACAATIASENCVVIEGSIDPGAWLAELPRCPLAARRGGRCNTSPAKKRLSREPTGTLRRLPPQAFPDVWARIGHLVRRRQPGQPISVFTR
jgi:hypothetical protein